MKPFRLDRIEVQHSTMLDTVEIAGTLGVMVDLSPRYKFVGVHFWNDDTYPIEFTGWDAPELQAAIAHIEAQIAAELEP